jgi:hypothetical protein
MSNHTASAARTTVTCSCKVCKINAEKIGAALPLAATVPTAHLTGRKVDASLRHILVRDAHDAGMIGRGVRARTGLLPA